MAATENQTATDGIQRSKIKRPARRGRRRSNRNRFVSQRNGRRYQRRRSGAQPSPTGTAQQQPYQAQQHETAHGSQPTSKKKMTGPIFYFIVVLATLKDISDAIFGATLFLSILSSITTTIVGVILAFYFFMNGVTPNTKKVAVWMTAFLIEWVPMLSLLPFTAFSVVVTRWFENGEVEERVEKLKKRARTTMQSI